MVKVTKDQNKDIKIKELVLKQSVNFILNLETEFCECRLAKLAVYNNLKRPSSLAALRSPFGVRHETCLLTPS